MAMEPPSMKKRRIKVPLPKVLEFSWNNPFNLEGKITLSTRELGDGATSRVYEGSNTSGNKLAVKRLKGYSVTYARTLVDTYEKFLYMRHPKITSVLGLCPNSGYVVLELCEKIIHNQPIHTLIDVMNMYGDDLPLDLKVLALVDISEGLGFLHANGIVHGDLKPLNVLVSGSDEEEFIFKITDYATSGVNFTQSSHSTTFKQLMTPSYTAPELFHQQQSGALCLPMPNKSSDIYSFGILAYEVFYCTTAWPNITLSLIENVKCGHRPAIPTNNEIEAAGVKMSGLIQECWLQDSQLRPTAMEVHRLLDEYFTAVQESQASDDTASPECEVSCCNLVSEDDDKVESEAELLPSTEDDALESKSDSFLLSQQSQRPQNEPQAVGMSQPVNIAHDLEILREKLNIKVYKQFQLEVIEALHMNKDVIVVQPTGSGKSLCYIAFALLNPGKVTLVIEPVVAVITDQVRSLKNMGLDAVALGRAAGNNKLTNFRRVFADVSNAPLLAFCTPEYLFGTPASDNFQATAGQFSTLQDRQGTFSLIVLDEAHKIFNRMPSFCPAFDDLRKLQEIDCSLLAMSATLTNEQIEMLKMEFLHSERCITFTQGVHRDNVRFHLRKYQYKRQKKNYEDCHDSSSDNDDRSDETDDDDDERYNTVETSPWYSTVEKIKNLTGDTPAIVYLDYVRDVEQVVEVLHDSGIKAAKYTGRMTIADRNEAEKAFLEGRTSIIVATESYELGVNNPNVSEIIRVGSPRNLGVLLQEFGRAGRKVGAIANAYLFFNESMDDKRLGLWLKSSLESEHDAAHEAVKAEILSTYKKTWQYVYSFYHGKCLMWAMSHFYGGADDEDPPTCFTANAPLCMTCEFSDDLCEITQDIKSHLNTLLATVKSLHSIGLTSITKTLLIGTLMGATSQYIERHERMDEIIDKADTCWGCGVFVNGMRMAAFAWHKVICVAIHLSLLDLTFAFRPFDNHIEVHRRLCLSTHGENFLVAPQMVMSPNPLSTMIDRLLDASKDASIHTKVQNRGIQLKPRIIRLLEERQWEEGSIEALKFIGYGNEGDTCLYFSDCQALPAATSDIHYLLKIPQLSRSQATIKNLEAIIDGKTLTLFANRSYCSGVKKCAGNECEYTVTKKQKINRCPHHPTSALIPTGPCSCHMVYVYPEEPNKDGRRWLWY